MITELLSGHFATSYFKILISLILCLAAYITYYSEKINQFFDSLTITRAFVLSFLGSRIIPFFMIYVGLGLMPHSDVLMFYDSALSAKDLQFVYRDFDSAYSPLFAYITALPLWLWNSPKAIVLMIVLIEGLIVWLSLKVFALGKKVLIPVYFLLPVSFMLIIFGGQEDIWMWGVFGAAIWYFRKNQNYLLLGVVLGLGLLITKALMILYILPILVMAKKPVHVMFGLLIVGIPSLAFMYYHSGLLFLSPIQQANDPRSPNIWSVLHTFTWGLVPIGPRYLNWVGLFFTQFFSIFWIRKFKNVSFEKQLLAVFFMVSLLIMIMQQSSLANYALIYILPLYWAFEGQISKKQLVYFLAAQIFFVFQPTLFWQLKLPVFDNIFELNTANKFLEFTAECVIMASLIWWLFKTKNADFYERIKIK